VPVSRHIEYGLIVGAIAVAIIATVFRDGAGLSPICRDGGELDRLLHGSGAA